MGSGRWEYGWGGYGLVGGRVRVGMGGPWEGGGKGGRKGIYT